MITRCVECGKEFNLESNANISDFQCECGGDLKYVAQNYPENQKNYVENKNKEPILSLILSFFIVGLGHLYNGQTEKGIILLIAGFVFAGLSLFLVGIPFFLAVWLYGMYDAYQSAVKINRGEEVKKSF
jgi:TM2 domain-containing membrane protein YozV